MRFVDTSWWVAWALPRDRHHDEAIALPQRLGATEQLLTTNHVVAESWTFLARKDCHRVALGFLDRIGELEVRGRLVVHRVTEEQEQAAWQWLRRYDERSYSFVDATSFRVMRDRRLREAFAFDHDFTAAGFVEVTA